MAKKHSKNLQKVQDMLDGKHESKIISGYLPTEETHKVGDRWFDSDGRELLFIPINKELVLLDKLLIWLVG